MSCKQRTIATFAVTIQVPTAYNLSDMQEYIRRALTATPCSYSPDEISNSSFTVALTKKVTTYGNN